MIACCWSVDIEITVGVAKWSEEEEFDETVASFGQGTAFSLTSNESAFEADGIGFLSGWTPKEKKWIFY